MEFKKSISFLYRCYQIYKIYLWFSTVGFSALVFGVLTTIDYFSRAPWFVLLVIALLGTLSSLFLYSCLYLYLWSNEEGIHTPRKIRWYKYNFPGRDITLDFDNYLGMNGRGQGESKKVQISGFQSVINIRKKDGIYPEKAVIRSKTTGQEYLVKFDTDSGYRTLENIKFMPFGAKVRAFMSFGDSTLSVTEFKKQFGGFDLEFIYDGKTFKREFPLLEIDYIITSFFGFGEGPKPPQIIATDY